MPTGNTSSLSSTSWSNFAADAEFFFNFGEGEINDGIHFFYQYIVLKTSLYSTLNFSKSSRVISLGKSFDTAVFCSFSICRLLKCSVSSERRG